MMWQELDHVIKELDKIAVVHMPDWECTEVFIDSYPNEVNCMDIKSTVLSEDDISRKQYAI